MSMNLRYPNITALSEKEQLVQIKSYLRQLVDQLNYGLPNAGSVDSAFTQTYEVQGEQISYYDLRSLIISKTEELDRLFGQLSAKMETDYVPTSGWESGMHLATDKDGVVVAVDQDEEIAGAVTKALAQAKESGEFDGADGQDGLNGQDGANGQDGYTPIKGTDYFTEEEVSATAAQAAGMISFSLDEEGNLYYEVITDDNTNNEVEE